MATMRMNDDVGEQKFFVGRIMDYDWTSLNCYATHMATNGDGNGSGGRV